MKNCRNLDILKISLYILQNCCLEYLNFAMLMRFFLGIFSYISSARLGIWFGIKLKFAKLCKKMKRNDDQGSPKHPIICSISILDFNPLIFVQGKVFKIKIWQNMHNFTVARFCSHSIKLSGDTWFEKSRFRQRGIFETSWFLLMGMESFASNPATLIRVRIDLEYQELYLLMGQIIQTMMRE